VQETVSDEARGDQWGVFVPYTRCSMFGLFDRIIIWNVYPVTKMLK